jgi:hypothetical protein
MAPEEKVNYLLILRVLIITILILMLLCIGFFGYDRMVFEKQIQQSNEPDQIGRAFLQALMTNHLRFAKKLVVPEQKLRIDQWKADTQHQSIHCPWNLDDVLGYEMVEWYSGGASYIDDRTVSGYYIDACSKNGYSIEVEGLIMKHDGKNWMIMHWDKICESHEYDSLRVCYPTE